MVFWLLACDSSDVILSDKCTVEIEQISPSPLIAGQEATLIATPMSEPWDSRIAFGDTSVLATELDRINCDACDSCRLQYECLDCLDCDSCDSLCEETCIEQMSFQVPSNLEGTFQLYLVNRFGQSSPSEITILGLEQDTGINDSGLQ